MQEPHVVGVEYRRMQVRPFLAKWLACSVLHGLLVALFVGCVLWRMPPDDEGLIAWSLDSPRWLQVAGWVLLPLLGLLDRWLPDTLLIAACSLAWGGVLAGCWTFVGRYRARVLARAATTLAGGLALAVALCVPCQVAAASGRVPESLVNIQAVKGLLAAADLASLDRAFEALDHPDAGLLAVYRTRRLALHPPSDEELAFLAALPPTQSDYTRVLALTEPLEFEADPVIAAAVDGLFRTAARLVAKQGRGHREFIELCDLADGAPGELAWPEFDWLLDNDRERTAAAIRALPLEVRVRLCDGEPTALTDVEVAQHCRSGL